MQQMLKQDVQNAKSEKLETLGHVPASSDLFAIQTMKPICLLPAIKQKPSKLARRLRSLHCIIEWIVFVVLHQENEERCSCWFKWINYWCLSESDEVFQKGIFQSFISNGNLNCIYHAIFHSTQLDFFNKELFSNSLKKLMQLK